MTHLSSDVSAESIASRLKAERLRLKLTQPDVAGLCEASKRSVIEWEKQTPIPSDKLAALVGAGFDTHYILTGQRPPGSIADLYQGLLNSLDTLVEKEAAQNSAEEKAVVKRASRLKETFDLLTAAGAALPVRDYSWGATKNKAEKLAEEGFALVPRYDIQGSMGGGAVVHSEQVVDHLAFRTEWVRSELRANPANLVLISAVGDSMEPSLSSGDLLLVDKSEYKIRDDAIYVISVNGSLLVKRVQLLLDGTVIIRSDNPAYQPQTVKQPDIEDLKVVGRVVWVGRRV